MYTTYRSLANSLLPISIQPIYIDYMNARWAHSEDSKCRDGYAMTWIERFVRGDEWIQSDYEGRRILQRLSPMYPRNLDKVYNRDTAEATWKSLQED